MARSIFSEPPAQPLKSYLPRVPVVGVKPPREALNPIQAAPPRPPQSIACRSCGRESARYGRNTPFYRSGLGSSRCVWQRSCRAQHQTLTDLPADSPMIRNAGCTGRADSSELSDFLEGISRRSLANAQLCALRLDDGCSESRDCHDGGNGFPPRNSNVLFKRTRGKLCAQAVARRRGCGVLKTERSLLR